MSRRERCEERDERSRRERGEEREEREERSRRERGEERSRETELEFLNNLWGLGNEE